MANEVKVTAKGINAILPLRLLKKSEEEVAWKLTFQTKHKNIRTRNSDSVATRDDPIRILGSLGIDFSTTSILSIGGPYVGRLEEALDNDDIIEIWEINRAEKGTGDNVDRYKTTYYQRCATSLGKLPNTEDTVEVSLEFGINGKGTKGFAILATDQEEAVQYVFKDMAVEKDNPEKVGNPSMENVAPISDGTSIELSQEKKTIMMDAFKIYKGQTEVVSGTSSLTIAGMEPNTSVSIGEYQVVCIVNGKESERVGIPVLEALSIAITGLDFSPKTSTADTGTVGSQQTTTTVLPENATTKKVTCDISSVTEGLAVSETGNITWVESVPAGIYTTTGTTENDGRTIQHTLTLNNQT